MQLQGVLHGAIGNQKSVVVGKSRQTACDLGPIAAVQASTLAGLGYFYQRLNVLEANDVLPPAPSVLSSSLQDVKPLRVVRTSRIPLPPPPAPAPVARVPVALNNNTAVIDFTRVGQDFSAVAVKRPAVVTQKTLLTSKTAVKKVKAVKAIKANDDERVAQANRSEILRKQESSDASFQLAPSFQENVVAANAVVIPDDVPRGQPLPVGIITWVYLGNCVSKAGMGSVCILLHTVVYP
ncbi:hypothetical protein [Thiothrix subterranea]|uniref:hypothetical protein n=1 Tax=Thiothrix subterranea TaxID=2735563 RepID=UPI00280B91F4|nr:hypothetical protein [Thiothrix subterranea]